jgi:hypothetical protein
MFLIPVMIPVVVSLGSGLFVFWLWPSLSDSELSLGLNILLYFVSFFLAFLVAFWPLLLLGKTRTTRKGVPRGDGVKNEVEGLSGVTSQSSNRQTKRGRARKGSGFSLFQLIWLGFVVSLYVFFLYRFLKPASASPPSFPVLIIIEGIVGFLAYSAAVGVASLAILRIRNAQKRRINSLYPDAMLIHGLQNIAYLLRTRPTTWNELKFKCELMTELESIASCVQNNLPRRLKSGDALTDVWIRERSMQIAAAIRSLKQWIVTPKLDTYDGLCSRVTDTFLQAVDGNWDGLERIAPPKLSQRQLYARVTGIVGGILLSALPLVGLYLLQKSQFKLQGTIADYVTLVAIAWAVVSLLSTLDPAFSAKLSAVKDIASSVATLGKGK